MTVFDAPVTLAMKREKRETRCTGTNRYSGFAANPLVTSLSTSRRRGIGFSRFGVRQYFLPIDP